MKIYSSVPRHLAAVHCIIFGYDISEKEIRLLLVKRSFEPSMGKWSLAGGFVMENESLDEAASRILFNLTGLNNVYLEQSHTFGDPQRDPGARVISTSYYALIKIQDIDNLKKEENGAHWQSLTSLPELIFDHGDMVNRALSCLRHKVRIDPVGFELLPEKFTLVQLQDLYEAIFKKEFDKRNFRKKILSMEILDKLEEKEKKTSKKGAWYYRFRYDKFAGMKRNGYYFNLDVT